MEERLQKILARGGLASRRAAERLIEEGRVRVNGRVVTELGAKADPRRDKIEVDGTRVVAERLVYVALHKPRGVVSTLSDPEGRPCVKELLAEVGARVFPVGRLDFATSGVLLATNDGAFADGLLHPRREVPKTYVVKSHGVMQPEHLEMLRKGVRLEDGMTAPAQAALIRHEGDKTWFELTIHEGRNQQVRRMGDATGFPVMRLSRVSFAGITLEGLKPGKWRFLTRDELATLKKTYGVPRVVATPPGAIDRAERAAKGRHAVARSAKGRAEGARGPRDEGPRGSRAEPRGPRDTTRGPRDTTRGPRDTMRGPRDEGPRGSRAEPRGPRDTTRGPRDTRDTTRGPRDEGPRGSRAEPRGPRDTTRGRRGRGRQ